MNMHTQQVLNWLAEQTQPNGEMCAGFKGMIHDLNLDRKTVRKACRLLKRQGLAEFHTGLWNEDGEPCGSGYCISVTGRQVVAGASVAPATT